LRCSDFDRAFNAFDSASKAEPGSETYAALRAWSAYAHYHKTGMAYRDFTAERCVRDIERALRSLPTFDSGYVFLAHIQLDQDNHDAAQAAANAALAINHRNAAAKTLLRRIEAKRPRATSPLARISAWLTREAA